MPNPLIPYYSSLYVGLGGFGVGSSPGSFSEAYFATDANSFLDRRFGDYAARRLRYAVLWAHFEGNVYRRVHSWAEPLKSVYGLNSYTRTIYSPAYVIGEFWASHIMGGPLDPDAGDGEECPTALPIIIPGEQEGEDVAPDAPDSTAGARPSDIGMHPLRRAISTLWRASNWQASKETYTRFGAVLGDVFLKVEDDPTKGRVSLCVVHPGTVRDVTCDGAGNVRGYVIEEQRPDPEWPFVAGQSAPLVAYTEVAERVGDAILYRTFKGIEPYDWRYYPDERTPRVGPEWTEDYGFVPLIKIQHRDSGFHWGWSELHSDLSKLHEVDDLASKLDDQIRKMVDTPIFFSGVKGEGDISVDYPDAETENDEPGRDRLPTLYGPQGSTATFLVAPLDIASTSAHIQTILKAIERAHPELQADMATAAGDASGRALRVARERVAAMVVQRRATYDDGLVRAHKMALSIGGMKGYEGYEGIDDGSYDRGELDHSIGPRPVFSVDALDEIAEHQARALNLKTLTDAGMPLETAMKASGYDEDLIAEMKAAQQAESKKALADIKTRQKLAFSDGGGVVQPGSSALVADRLASRQLEGPNNRGVMPVANGSQA